MSTQDPNMDPLAIAIKAVEIYATAWSPARPPTASLQG